LALFHLVVFKDSVLFICGVFFLMGVEVFYFAIIRLITVFVVLALP
jgi:hypothetical protein